MLSAPTHIPAITVSSLGAGFADPDLIRGVLIDTFSVMISGSRVCSASPSSGTSPAYDTKLSSSKRADVAENLWETRTESASLEFGSSVPRNTHYPSSGGTFAINTLLSDAARLRIQAKPVQLRSEHERNLQKTKTLQVNDPLTQPRSRENKSQPLA